MACKRSPVRSRYSPPEQDTTQKCAVSFCLHQTSEAFAPPGERRAWTARGHRDWNGPVFSTKKALYFIGSMVLFFLLKLVFGGCITSPAPFSGFCRRFLYNPQVLPKSIVLSASGALRGRFNGSAGKMATFPINRLRGRVGRRRTDDRQKLLYRFPTISVCKIK